MPAPTLPVQVGPALVRGQAELWQSLWWLRCLSALPQGAALQLESLTYSEGDVCFHLSFASSPLFCSPVSGVGVQCFATPSKGWVQALHTIAALPLEHP